jgi:hypothetical protein
MNNDFIKLFGHQLLTSTLWLESDSDTKVVWITLLCWADCDGIIELTIPGLAHLAGVHIDKARAAVEKFLAPDTDSRNPMENGRRLLLVKGGWRLTTYDEYRHKLDAEEQREKTRIRVERHRAKRRNAGNAESPFVTASNADVTPSNDVTKSNDSNDNIEVEVEVDKEGSAARFALPDWIPKDVWRDYIDMRKRIRKPATERAMKLIVTELEKLRAAGENPKTVLERSILNSWTGVFSRKDNRKKSDDGAYQEIVIDKDGRPKYKA